MAFGNVGTGIQQPPAQLIGTANAITQKYIMPSLGDAVMQPSPVFWAMTRKGVQVQGGEIVYGIVNQEETTGGAYWGDQLLNTQVIDSIAPATQVWRFYYEAIAIPVTDAILNRGRGGVLSLIESKYEVACSSFLMKLSRALWHTSPQNTSIDIDDISSWVLSTTNTIAGIDRSVAANAFWKAAAVTNNGVSPLLPANAESAYQSAVWGYDEPDLLVIDRTKYAGFKSQFTQLTRFTGEQDQEAVQAGFRYHFLFNNAVVVPDAFVPSGTAWILNTKYLYPLFHEDDYFQVDPFVKPSNQRVVVSNMYLAWQLICQSPRMNAPISNV